MRRFKAFKTLRHRLYRQLLMIATIAFVGLTFSAVRSDAARVVVRVVPGRHHRPVIKTVVVKPAARRVYKAGHWVYRPALGRHVWVPGHWVTIR